MENQTIAQETMQSKFCKHCGAKIAGDVIICTACGRQVEELKSAPAIPNIVVNNTNTNTNTNVNNNGMMKKPKNKWVALGVPAI